MYRLAPLTLVFVILFAASVASAALPPAYYTNQSALGSCTASQPCGTAGKIITFYVPHEGANCATSIEGCIATSKPGLGGKSEPITVDAVRLHKAQYATCASDPSNYGKYFNIGTVTYRSALDEQMYTVQNVTCYVHDTGSAFTGRPDKLDLATTICATCTDAQAGAIGRGAAVQVAGAGPVDLTPANIGSPAWNGSGSYCITSIEPVVVVPSGTVPASQCYNQQPAGMRAPQPLPPPAPAASVSQQTSQPSLGQQISQFLFGNQSTSTQVANPVALLIAQPASVTHGNPVLVSWSSLGMSPQTPCQVSQSGQPIAQTNVGSQIIQTTFLQSGMLTFTLSCTTQAGLETQQSASVTVN